MRGDDPIAVSGVTSELELMAEKYMDPPAPDATDDMKHAHQDIHKLIGICQGLAAAVLALSRPIVIQNGKQ